MKKLFLTMKKKILFLMKWNFENEIEQSDVLNQNNSIKQHCSEDQYTQQNNERMSVSSFLVEIS